MWFTWEVCETSRAMHTSDVLSLFVSPSFMKIHECEHIYTTCDISYHKGNTRKVMIALNFYGN